MAELAPPERVGRATALTTSLGTSVGAGLQQAACAPHLLPSHPPQPPRHPPHRSRPPRPRHGRSERRGGGGGGGGGGGMPEEAWEFEEELWLSPRTRLGLGLGKH